MKKPENDFEKSQSGRTKWYVWLFVALLGALLLSNMAGETIKNMFFSLLGGLTPVLGAIILSFILLNPIKWIEKKLLKNAFVGNPRGRTYKRLISLAVSYLIVIGFLVALVFALVPNLIGTLRELVGSWDTTITALEDTIKGLIINITGMTESAVDEALKGFFAQLSHMLEDWGTWITENLANVATIVGNAIFVFAMSILLSFLMLKDKERISKLSRRVVYAYNPKHKADEILMTAHRTQKVLDQWLVCNLITMGTIFVLAWIGYAVIGVKLAGLMALLLAIFSLVPYIGGFIAIVPVVLMTLAFNPSALVAAVVFGLALWAIVVTFLPPVIMSNRFQTRAVFILLVMVVAGALFGVWGMILSGPIAAMLNIWVQERLQAREALREKEEIAVSSNVPLGDLSDVLDLREDVDDTLLDTIEEEKQNLTKRSLFQKRSKTKQNKNEKTKD